MRVLIGCSALAGEILAMTANGWFQIFLFLAVIFAITKPLGIFIARVFNRQKTFLDAVLRPIEKLIYRLTGVDEQREMRWTEYGIAMLLFSGVSLLLLYAIERVQQWLPLNPQRLTAVAPDLAFNTAVSFATNTNWQSYTPETTMSYFTQVVAFTVQNFVSAAAGMAVAVALIRAFSKENSRTIGNFWVDLTRSVLWILLPISIIIVPIFIWQGVPQNFDPHVTV